MSSSSELLLKLKLTRENFLGKLTLTRFDTENSLLTQIKSDKNNFQEKHKNDRNIKKPVNEPKKDIAINEKLINHKIVII